MPCIVCRAEDWVSLYRWNGGLGVQRCRSCGLLATDPLPTAAELTDYYRNLSRDEGEEHGHMRPYEGIEDVLPLIRSSVSRYLDIAKDVNGGAPTTKFLDLGAGIGLYSKAAEDLGCEAHMVEIDDQAAAFARETLGLRNIVQADVQSVAEHPARPFDLVLSRHVIEHLREPDSFVANLAELTAPGKVLVLETPNADNWEQWAHPAMFRNHWRTLTRENPELSVGSRLARSVAKPLSAAAPPKHLWGFTEHHLAVLLERHGFVLRKAVATVAGDRVFDPLYYHDGRRRRARDRVYRLYERATSPLIRAIGKGSRLVVFAQRNPQRGASRE